jgi:hypothetical protein
MFHTKEDWDSNTNSPEILKSMFDYLSFPRNHDLNDSVSIQVT